MSHLVFHTVAVIPHGAFDCFPVPFLDWTRSADPIVVLVLHSFLLNTHFYIGTHSTSLPMYQHTCTGKSSLSPNHPHCLPEGKSCVLANEQEDAVSCCCLDSRAVVSLHKQDCLVTAGRVDLFPTYLAVVELMCLWWGSLLTALQTHMLSWHCGYLSSWDFSCRCPKDIATRLLFRSKLHIWMVWKIAQQSCWSGQENQSIRLYCFLHFMRSLRSCWVVKQNCEPCQAASRYHLSRHTM